MASFGLFVFLFLTLFQPFGLYVDHLPTLLVVTGTYGFITFIVGIITTKTAKVIFPTYFKSANWTLGKELSISILNICMIGIGNLIYSNIRFNIELAPVQLLMFQFYTLLVGFFPVFFFILLRFARLMSENTQIAENLATMFRKHKNTNKATITFKSELKNDDLTIPVSAFLFATSADNYVEIHHNENGIIKQKLIRNTLSNLEEYLAEYHAIVRCHRAYLINLDLVTNCKGNAQGLLISLNGSENEIPVARNKVVQIKEHLS